MSGNDGGKYILLEKTFNPAGVPGDSDKDSCMVSLFEPKDQQNKSPTPPRSPQIAPPPNVNFPNDDTF